ncbi:MAG: hypothetical protein ACXVP0_11035 [Bacteroidia bacterium]
MQAIVWRFFCSEVLLPMALDNNYIGMAAVRAALAHDNAGRKD